jgi:hypothetical protein
LAFAVAFLVVIPQRSEGICFLIRHERRSPTLRRSYLFFSFVIRLNEA